MNVGVGEAQGHNIKRNILWVETVMAKTDCQLDRLWNHLGNEFLSMCMKEFLV